MDCNRRACVASNKNVWPRPVLTRSGGSLSEKLYALGTALVLAAVVAAGFALSYAAYGYLATNAPTAPMETLGELWDGTAP